MGPGEKRHFLHRGADAFLLLEEFLIDEVDMGLDGVYVSRPLDVRCLTVIIFETHDIVLCVHVISSS
jgi:hypothetical protein